jgi:hypothetical protein
LTKVYARFTAAVAAPMLVAMARQPPIQGWSDNLRLAALRRAGSLDRIIGGTACLLQGWLRRAVCRTVPSRLRDEATRRVYSHAYGYEPGGHEFEKGLFSWEEEFLASVEAGSLVLVAGAGGGRQLSGLAQLGLDALAFEPSELVAAAQTTATGLGQRPARRASHHDLVRAAQGEGPLADLPDEPIAAVLFGWGSISHVTARQDRIDVLTALRQLAPTAPVLYSFIHRGSDDRPFSDRGRLRYDPGIGFFADLQPSDVDDEARAAGYTVKRMRVEPFGHAWLSPE